MSTHPYFVPGVRRGSEFDDLATLETLVRDLASYSAGRLPSADDLAMAPLLTGWRPVGDASSCRLVGMVSDHPRIGPGHGVTSRIYALGHDRTWARTYSRLWRLGPTSGH